MFSFVLEKSHNLNGITEQNQGLVGSTVHEAFMPLMPRRIEACSEALDDLLQSSQLFGSRGSARVKSNPDFGCRCEGLAGLGFRGSGFRV